LQDHDVGISRYGDGELAYLFGGGTTHEKNYTELSRKIRENLENYGKDVIENTCLIALPISLTLGQQFKKRNASRDYWQSYKKYSMMPFLKKDAVYGSPFCFRIDTIDHCDRRGHLVAIKSLFEDKNVIYVSDNRDLSRVTIDEHIEIPSEDAYKHYDAIVHEIKEVAKKYDNELVLVTAGVTATAISFELNERGILTYDIGKLYRWL
jgi:hypothetical protein